MTDMMDLSCRNFMDKLSGPDPTPGGGGASALGGALGIGLANMVSSLTVGKEKYADVEDEMQGLLKKGLTLQKELLDLVQEDAKVFSVLAGVYAYKAETDQEKSHKKELLSQASINATKVPLAIAEKVFEAMKLTRTVAGIGNKLVISDAACAILFLHAALAAAGFNIMINLPHILDQKFVQKTQDSLGLFLHDGEVIMKHTMTFIEDRMKG
ncbi:MAG: cyclodeaminase/cyclohydrolase family protein [Bacillota bacterium]|jgi:formiminotetrahydrofolate cyclodeaminase